jgi:hypothetical protein
VDAVLHASHFPGSHTGVNIAEMLTQMFTSWEISETRCQLLVRDGASNMYVGCDIANIPSIHCTIHKLQLVIEDAILTNVRSLIFWLNVRGWSPILIILLSRATN